MTTTSTSELRPPSFGRVTWIVAMATAAALVKRKRLIFLFVVLCLPSLISMTMKIEGDPDGENFYGFVPAAFFLFLAPIISLFHGASVFADEIDGRTLSYLLIRPVSRENLLVGKATGAWLVSCVLLGFSSLSAHLPHVFDGTAASLVSADFLLRYGQFAAVLCLAAALYTVMSVFLGVALKHPMLVGIAWMLIVEAVFCWAPGPPSKIALSYHLTRLLPDVYLTPEELVASDMNLGVLEPNVVFTLLGLLVVLSALLAAGIAVVKSSDLAVGEDD